MAGVGAPIAAGAIVRRASLCAALFRVEVTRSSCAPSKKGNIQYYTPDFSKVKPKYRINTDLQTKSKELGLRPEARNAWKNKNKKRRQRKRAYNVGLDPAGHPREPPGPGAVLEHAAAVVVVTAAASASASLEEEAKASRGRGGGGGSHEWRKKPPRGRRRRRSGWWSRSAQRIVVVGDGGGTGHPFLWRQKSQKIGINSRRTSEGLGHTAQDTLYII